MDNVRVHYYDIINSYSYHKKLENMREEIRSQISYNGFFNDGIERALQIIDKYIMEENDEQEKIL